MTPCRLVIALVAASVSACSAVAPATRQADPLALDARAPALTYDSALTRYQSNDASAALDWKQANAAVAGGAGHAGHHH